MTALDKAEPKPLMEEELKGIEARCNAATPGPWTNELRYIAGHIPGGRPNGEIIMEARYWSGSENAGLPERNSAFVAAARTDVPRLLTELRRLREENRELKAKIAEHLKAFRMEDWK